MIFQQPGPRVVIGTIQRASMLKIGKETAGIPQLYRLIRAAGLKTGADMC